MHFLLDGDGVLWRGSELLPGAIEFLNLLRRRGISFSFISNNSGARRAKLSERFESLGIPIRENEIFNTNYASGWYFKRKHADKLILVLGHPCLSEELLSVGLKVVTPSDILGQELQQHSPLSVTPYLSSAIAFEPEIVLMGIDTGINYARLALACRLIEDGALFYATNRDYIFPAEEGYLLPGNGAFVEVVEKVTGKSAICLGKPEPYLVELIEEEKGISRAEMIIVGDRLDTDILLANRLGIRSVLVLTGISGKQLAEKKAPGFSLPKPTYTVNDLQELLQKFDALFL